MASIMKSKTPNFKYRLNMNAKAEQELNTFIEEWKETPDKNKTTFSHFKDYLSKKEGVTLDFVSRPGVTYSLRAVHANQKKKIFL